VLTHFSRKQGQIGLRIFLFELTQNLLDHLPVFQTDGQKDGFHWPGTSHVNSSMGMEFGPVEKAIEGLLVFFAQSPSKGFPPFPFGFQNMPEGDNCSAHISPP
jgi:hypothetical protein